MTKVEILYLDDMEVRHEQFELDALRAGHRCGVDVQIVHVWTAEEAIEVLSKREKPFGIISLDHDLQEEHYEDLEAAAKSGNGTGFEVAKYIAEHPHLVGGIVVIHSWNPAGVKNMAEVLSSRYVLSNQIRFGNHLWLNSALKSVAEIMSNEVQ